MRAVGGTGRIPRATAENLAGLLVAAFVYEVLRRRGIAYGERITVLTVAAALALVLSRRPAIALGVILIWVPLQQDVLAYLYRQGAPASAVRELGYIKELMVVALLVAVVRKRPRRPFDTLDRWVAVYVGLCVLYFVAPALSSGLLGNQSLSVRENAVRLEGLFALLFLLMRRVEITRRQRAALATCVMIVVVILAGFGIWEFVSPSGFNRFLVRTVQLGRYQTVVLHAPPRDPTYLLPKGAVGSTTFNRIGSLFADDLSLGFYLLVGLGIGLNSLAARRLRPAMTVATAATAVTLLFTLTRSAILGGAVAAALALVVAVRRRAPGRVRIALALAAGLVLITPVVASTALTVRVFGSSGTADASNQAHRDTTVQATEKILKHPLGLGLGANPATGMRLKTSNVLDTENSYLQVASELGFETMVVFIGMLVLLIRRLYLRAIAEPDPEGSLAGAMVLSGAGLAVAGFFLHVWLSLPTALSFWGLAGAALPVRDRVSDQPRHRAPDQLVAR